MSFCPHPRPLSSASLFFLPTSSLLPPISSLCPAVPLFVIWGITLLFSCFCISFCLPTLWILCVVLKAWVWGTQKSDRRVGYFGLPPCHLLPLRQWTKEGWPCLKRGKEEREMQGRKNFGKGKMDAQNIKKRSYFKILSKCYLTTYVTLMHSPVFKRAHVRLSRKCILVQ